MQFNLDKKIQNDIEFESEGVVVETMGSFEILGCIEHRVMTSFKCKNLFRALQINS